MENCSFTAFKIKVFDTNYNCMAVLTGEKFSETLLQYFYCNRIQTMRFIFLTSKIVHKVDHSTHRVSASSK